MKHHAESEACDLLMEVEKLELLEQYVDKNSFGRATWSRGISRVSLQF